MIKQSADVAQMAEKVKGLHELRRMIAEAKRQEETLTDEVKSYMDEQDTDWLDLEGAPACRLKPRSTGMKWDSHAIREMQEKRPHEWQRIVELGAVKLSVDVLRKAVENNQLAGMPVGGIQGTTTALVFEEER